ncbi:hypothetical protein NQ315_012483 [Exocentrus adspersus]|uniref:Transposase n=1 Tax=Exocentrus adspersus TaxID=1586481 RepID=A0AAV8VBY2_9CUCU|nr:hypothetical protein NQ315_012483 [Exocentrus adspersus]
MSADSVDAVIKLLEKVNRLRICDGLLLQARSSTCIGYLPPREPRKCGRQNKKCKFCTSRLKKASVLASNKHLKLGAKFRAIKEKHNRLRVKVSKLSQEMQLSKFKCAIVEKEVLEKAITDMPPSQQEVVRTCFAAAKVRNPKGRRYTMAWIYDCILLRIKSRASYEHLRNTLPLPCAQTLHKYIKRVQGCYGFQKSVFQLLKEKSKVMSPEERRGVLLIDEMKVTETVSFDKATLKVNGFTDLGDYTPLHQKNMQGDHALVIMFQPFRGSWVQALAAFLSKGCASATVLHHFIIECIMLLERSGFYVDVVTTDGASWNRGMWKKFNITEENVSCEHIMDSSRRLWFCSDFPHLLKNVRNFIVSKPETWTPDGVVKLHHWDRIVELEQPMSYTLKLAPKLCHDNVHPKHYQKMNVGRAYRDIEEFITYLKQWQIQAETNNYFFLSNNTYHGLIVSLKAVLEILKFLSSFQYLMTTRLNQDALERFFGMMRNACGCNDHPDSRLLFIQMYKLITTYSLVKPPKGCNIDGGKMISVLLNLNDISKPDAEGKIEQFQANIDNFIENQMIAENVLMNINNEHDYCGSSSANVLLAYMAGYVMLEELILAELELNEMTSDIFLSITSKLENAAVQLVGCEQHKKILTGTDGVTSTISIMLNCG